MKENKFNNKKAISLLLVFALIASIFIPIGQIVFADGGSGSGNTGSGKETGNRHGYRYWFDNYNDGNPTQGWNEDSINWWQNYIENKLGQKMAKQKFTTDKSYYQAYREAAEEALRDARKRSGTNKARIVGVTSYQYDPSSNLITPVNATNLFKNWGKAPTAQELPDSSGWSTIYRNKDGASQGTWRNWLYEYGKAKAGGDDAYLTVVVWAVAEGEPMPPAPPTQKVKLRKVTTIPSLIK